MAIPMCGVLASCGGGRAMSAALTQAQVEAIVASTQAFSQNNASGNYGATTTSKDVNGAFVSPDQRAVVVATPPEVKSKKELKRAYKSDKKEAKRARRNR